MANIWGEFSLSELKQEAAKILLDSLFYVEQFSFEGVDKASTYIASREVSHLQTELEGVHKEKDHAFINNALSYDTSVWFEDIVLWAI